MHTVRMTSIVVGRRLRPIDVSRAAAVRAQPCESAHTFCAVGPRLAPMLRLAAQADAAAPDIPSDGLLTFGNAASFSRRMQVHEIPWLALATFSVLLIAAGVAAACWLLRARDAESVRRRAHLAHGHHDPLTGLPTRIAIAETA